jgi:cellulose/xylan binding protein with CBM9 domain
MIHKHTWTSVLLIHGLTILLFPAFGNVGRAEDYHVIPYDVDPPIVVDGDLADWENVPNAFELKDKANVTLGTGAWSGTEDLSGRIRLTWHRTGICVAAEVTDDVVSQTASGRDLWKGDYVNLLVDLTPGVQAERSALGDGQFHVGISPGSFDVKVGGKSLPAEIVVWTPADAPEDGGHVVSSRTEDGYLIEAFVPWSRVGTSPATMNKDANFEFALSDCDTPEPRQETWMTVGTVPWKRIRARLQPMVFGDGNGTAQPPVRGISIQESAKVPQRQSLSISFDASTVPQGKDPFLFFKARFDRKKVAGFAARTLWVDVNGERVTGDRIANRPQTSLYMSGKEATFIAPDGGITVPYAPSPEAFDKHPYYRLIGNIKGCEFEFNLAGLLQQGENTVTFHNTAPAKLQGDYDVILEDVEFRLKAQGATAIQLKPAPTGPLPVYEPRKEFPKTWSHLEQRQGEISLKVNDEPFTITSTFTAPDGKTYQGSSPFYTHTREVIERGEWIEVRDTFKNLTSEHVPIIQTHTCSPGPERTADVYLSCVRLPTGQGRKSEPANPTALVTTAKSGLGMLPLNDVFRVHGDQSAADGAITIGDRHFVLKADSEYTAEWAVVPVAEPDLWTFINAARRMMNVNFPMRVLSAFLAHKESTYEWSDTMLRDFIDRKSVNVISKGLYCAKWKGRVPQGLAWQELLKEPKNRAYYTDARDRIKKLFPDGSVKFSLYYHCFIDVMDENVERYADCRRLNADGTQMVYSLDHYRMYVPTLENEFGKAIGRGIDIRLDELGADAFYWDEYNQSRGTYTYAPNMWDGCSADIDSKTYKIRRLKGAVHLLSLPFLKHHIQRVLDRVPAFFNGAPYSRSLADLHFQCFAETGSISNCHRMVLYTPVALGDHLTERSQQDAYRVMLRALDWGCLYAWYSNVVIPTHKTLTEHMFPATPIELHEGFVICEERIVTNRSGLFGWGDASDFTIHVYDREGRLTQETQTKQVTRESKTYAEVRIPEGYSAAIVRAAKP